MSTRTINTLMINTSPPHMATKKSISLHSVGRRKNAIASVRLQSGNGKIVVNDRPVEEYFPGPVARVKYESPFKLTGVSAKYDASVKVVGGGATGQLEALVLGLSRALVVAKAEHKSILRSAGLLTRDPRQRQRRMIGTGGKARRRKQSPKR